LPEENENEARREPGLPRGAICNVVSASISLGFLQHFCSIREITLVADSGKTTLKISTIGSCEMEKSRVVEIVGMELSDNGPERQG
jgi:hypothetical protein